MAATNVKRVIYFHERIDATADRVRAKRSDFDMFRRDIAKDKDETWSELARVHGYHASARTETREPWFPDAKLFAKAPNLLAVCSLGAGYDVIDVDAATEAGVIVCNQSGANKEAVAEHAMSLMLTLSKKVMLADRHMRKNQNIERFLYTGNDLLGRTVGIIGCGNIGGRVAEICKLAFRMTVLGYDPYLTKEQLAAKGIEKVEMKELMQCSDYVTMHTPRTKETFGFVGYEQMSWMKPTAYLINTSRGGTYVEEDLARILREKKIAGAGIDVFLDEPPPLDHPLMAFDNVILTPHNAGATIESQDNVAIFSADQWIDIFDGKVPPRIVNKEAWPKYSQRFEKILGFKPDKLE